MSAGVEGDGKIRRIEMTPERVRIVKRIQEAASKEDIKIVLFDAIFPNDAGSTSRRRVLIVEAVNPEIDECIRGVCDEILQGAVGRNRKPFDMVLILEPSKIWSTLAGYMEVAFHTNSSALNY